MSNQILQGSHVRGSFLYRVHHAPLQALGVGLGRTKICDPTMYALIVRSS